MATQPQSANTPVIVSVPFDAAELSLMQDAADRAGKTVSEFAHEASVRAATAERDEAVPHRTPEQLRTLIDEARRLMREANPEGRDLVSELIAERRAEAARE
jgi:hypothetical protein